MWWLYESAVCKRDTQNSTFSLQRQHGKIEGGRFQLLVLRRDSGANGGLENSAWKVEKFVFE